MNNEPNDVYTGISTDLEALFAEVSRMSGFIEGDLELVSNSYSEELERQRQKLCILIQRS